MNHKIIVCLALSISTCLIILSLFFPHKIITIKISEPVYVSDIKSGGVLKLWLNKQYIGEIKNNMTFAGDDAINNRLFNSTWLGAVWNYIAIGTGDGSGEGKARTSLVAELDRKQATFWKPGDAQWGLNATFTFTGSYTIREAGIFNAASGGVMAFYVWTLNVGVTSADTLKISWVGTTSGN